jgi:hypothetical protein
MATLDAMSTIKETAFAIIRGQFSDVLTMFLRKDLNELLGDNSERSCKQCSYSEECEENLLIVEHALLILNRCLKFQINALIQNQTENALLLSILDVKNFEYGVSDIIQVCIWDEFKITIDAALQRKQNSKEIRWSSFYFLT